MSTQANVPPAPPDEWQPASGGEVVHLARTMRTRKSRRRFLAMGAGAAGSMVAAVAGWVVIRESSREREYEFGGLSCSEVLACGQDFLQGRLSPAEAEKVKQHIRLCPRCRPKFEEMGGAALLG